MRSDSRNPASNALPPGINEKELIAAVEASGYPLQGIVASKLLPSFSVAEEWGYIDDASKEHRSLDVFAHKQLSGDANTNPALGLLIECKRSHHPFIFFKRVIDRAAVRFPYIAGLLNSEVHISQPGSNQGVSVWPSHAMGLDALPYVANGPPVCASFSKAIFSGRKVELSGSEMFNTIVLPLVRAIRHAASLFQVRNQNAPFFPTLLLCVTVIDAPLLLVEAPGKANDPILYPWVRIVRQEADLDRPNFISNRFYTIDAVHIDFFDEFIGQHILPFAEEFAARARALGTVLHKGGNVSDLKNWTWIDLAPKS